MTQRPCIGLFAALAVDSVSRNDRTRSMQFGPFITLAHRGPTITPGPITADPTMATALAYPMRAVSTAIAEIQEASVRGPRPFRQTSLQDEERHKLPLVMNGVSGDRRAGRKRARTAFLRGLSSALCYVPVSWAILLHAIACTIKFSAAITASSTAKLLALSKDLCWTWSKSSNQNLAALERRMCNG
jgi:hypothetical protein